MRCSTLSSVVTDRSEAPAKLVRTALAAVALSSLALAQKTDAATAAQEVFAKHCVRCHGDGRLRGGVDLLRHHGLDQKGRVVPGDAAASRLYQAITHAGDPSMPPKTDRISEKEIAVIRRWIEAGAERPASARSAPAMKVAELKVQQADREYWAFRPLTRPTVPAVERNDWSKTPIDHFVLAALRKQGIEPNPSVSDAKLIRRMSFGLTGLPPTAPQLASNPGDVAAKLLQSPHYGERWARHWLDLARFAESTGYEADQDRRYAYKFRDAVIKALNEDLPYRDFVQWQIAGDEFAPDNPTAIALTGFLAAGPTITNEGGDRVKYEKLDDIVSTTGSAFLGLTIGCARCHDHKYDPISQRDYYEMVGVFLHCRERDVPLTSQVRDERAIIQRDLKKARSEFNRWRNFKKGEIRTRRVDELPVDDEAKQLLLAKRNRRNKEQESLFRKFDRKLRISDRDMERELQEDERATMQRMRVDQKRLDEKLKETDEHMGRVMVESNRRTGDNFLLGRGNYRNKSEKIGFGFLSALMPRDDASMSWFTQPPKDAKTPWRRRALARWITDTKKGAGSLLARVIVNRVWQHHFGRGIARTTGNFGVTGDAPTHPELLDWLACELVANDWSLKHIHRLILASAVYRQSGVTDAARSKVDPENHLWWRRKPQRMEAEVWRDSVLAVSGVLNVEMFGPSIKPWMPTDAISTGSTRKWPVNVKDGPATWRRSIYIYTKRSMLMPMLESLDFPDSTISCSVRNTTTAPPAALLMLNNAFIRDQARHTAKRVASYAGRQPKDQILHLYTLALGRAPATDELERGLAFLETQTRSYGKGATPTPAHAMSALVNYCQAILTLNEFLYID
jgi:mono/diheme cytochrome c family protein